MTKNGNADCCCDSPYDFVLRRQYIMTTMMTTTMIASTTIVMIRSLLPSPCSPHQFQTTRLCNRPRCAAATVARPAAAPGGAARGEIPRHRGLDDAQRLRAASADTSCRAASRRPTSAAGRAAGPQRRCAARCSRTARTGCRRTGAPKTGLFIKPIFHQK